MKSRQAKCDEHIFHLNEAIDTYNKVLSESKAEMLRINDGTDDVELSRNELQEGLESQIQRITILKKIKNNEMITSEEYSSLLEIPALAMDDHIVEYQHVKQDNPTPSLPKKIEKKPEKEPEQELKRNDIFNALIKKINQYKASLITQSKRQRLMSVDDSYSPDDFSCAMELDGCNESIAILTKMLAGKRIDPVEHEFLLTCDIISKEEYVIDYLHVFPATNKSAKDNIDFLLYPPKEKLVETKSIPVPVTVEKKNSLTNLIATLKKTLSYYEEIPDIHKYCEEQNILHTAVLLFQYETKERLTLLEKIQQNYLISRADVTFLQKSVFLQTEKAIQDCSSIGKYCVSKWRYDPRENFDPRMQEKLSHNLLILEGSIEEKSKLAKKKPTPFVDFNAFLPQARDYKTIEQDTGWEMVERKNDNRHKRARLSTSGFFAEEFEFLDPSSQNNDMNNLKRMLSKLRGSQ